MTFLHGFLGDPSDGEFLRSDASLNLVDWTPLIDSVPLDTRAKFLPTFAELLYETIDSDNGVLMGYSLGGRIALHLLLIDSRMKKKKWRKAIIISASPGLQTESERRLRYESDQEWARKFRDEDWKTTVNEWLGQPLFFSNELANEKLLKLKNKREFIAKLLVLCSISKQEDLRNDLPSLNLPILFVAGEMDRKYCELAKECASLNTDYRYEIIANAGHRCAYTHKNEFLEICNSFCQD